MTGFDLGQWFDPGFNNFGFGGLCWLGPKIIDGWWASGGLGLVDGVVLFICWIRFWFMITQGLVL